MTLLLLCLAAAGVIAGVTSGATGLGLLWLRGPLRARAPAAQARLLTAAALAPSLVTIAVMTAALAPLFGWIVDHCLVEPHVHDHPHICGHHAAAAPATTVLVAGLAFAARSLWKVLTQARLLWQAWRLERALLATATRRPELDAYELPVGEPQAFVLGALRPRLFLARGLWHDAHADHRDAIVAHERAHLAAGHTRWRLLVGLALGWHLPGVARRLEDELSVAHELVADAHAATALGSARRVAQALLHAARHVRPRPEPAFAFDGHDLERRVRALLDPGPATSHPSRATLTVSAAALLIAIAAHADAIHHEVEHLLGLLSLS